MNPYYYSYPNYRRRKYRKYSSSSSSSSCDSVESQIMAVFSRTGGHKAKSIKPGQPFKFKNKILSNKFIRMYRGLFKPFTKTGAIFVLTQIGKYEITIESTYNVVNSVVLYAGKCVSELTPIEETNTELGNNSMSLNFIIKTCHCNTIISFNASPKNTTPIIIPSDSLNGITSTIISIKKI